MSLYYEAASVLANAENVGGSLKSRLYRQKDLKSSPAQLFALISETSKWSPVLKDERKLTPVLALLLTHDVLLSKSGVAANANHVLKLAIHRHKARLGAEFTKARLRRGYATLDAFREAANDGALEEGHAEQKRSRHPRWVRVNTLVTTVEEQLATSFAGYEKADKMSQVMAASGSTKLYFPDPNIPNLLALPPKIDLSKTPAYTGGRIILQDKASCFPAHLMNVTREDGDVIDGCAAPGNKTTHLAAIVSNAKSKGARQHVIAFERDKIRAGTLKKMVKLASADRIVTVKSGADFLAAAPEAQEFANVGAILLDPSCSGSGIVGRDDAVRMHLPEQSATTTTPTTNSKNSKKRKRPDEAKAKPEETTTLNLAMDDTTAEETPVLEDKLAERLIALSTFQFRILTHAMSFPNARKITYSTCSIHFEENEGVVTRALLSSVAKEGGWSILKRADQVDGLKTWKRRGVWEDGKLEETISLDEDRKAEICEACIRCDKGTDEGTMGFFVAAFVRAAVPNPNVVATNGHVAAGDEEWNGFSDDDVDTHRAVQDLETSPHPTSEHPNKKKKKGKKK
ncbi:S-adenosyl-L-methionine-dependent methyltransferase [Massarina eburnea CBS 473.64]|uniref:S-adenosyl-L-methionine-dependent methyltransferase n=1 Tax=Massarina eburnea CBS 473.64 TaxID=1395130 RepID=A0A6A6S2A4_9PLEO|nr:S-adenosyl-L-methionine-dependent methyltransferase [Massarina eburnea CBS 473.64]